MFVASQILPLFTGWSLEEKMSKNYSFLSVILNLSRISALFKIDWDGIANLMYVLRLETF